MDQRPKEDRALRQQAGKPQRKENPFDDDNIVRSPPTQLRDANSESPSTARTGRSSSQSIIMARGAFSKGLHVFKERELSQVNQSGSNGDLFEYIIAPKDKDGRTNAPRSSPREKGSPVFRDNQEISGFSPRSYGVTRNQLQDSHSRSSVSTHEIDSFGMESTFDEGFHTAHDLQSMQDHRQGTPPNSSHKRYHQSPSYSMHGDVGMVDSDSLERPSLDQTAQSYGVNQAPILIAKGPGDNSTSKYGGSSTLSFTNTVPYDGIVSSASNLDQLGALNSGKDSKSKKGKEKKVKKNKFSPNSTAISAISENQLYSGLSDMHTGLFLSTLNTNRATTPPPKAAKLKGFPTELPPRPTQRSPMPIRVTAEARAQFVARKQDERLALERRLAQPHLVRRSLPASKTFSGISLFKNLTFNGWVAIGLIQFGFLSTAVCVGAIITVESTSKSGPVDLSVPMIWWLVLSILLLCVGISIFVVLRVRGILHNPQPGFRRRVGSREIVDGHLGRRGDVENTTHGQRSFEMVSGAHITRREAFTSFDTPQSVQNAYTEVLRPNNMEIFRRVPNSHHGFEQVPTYGARGGLPYEAPPMNNSPEIGNYRPTAVIPATPLTPLPQAVLSPITFRDFNDCPTHQYTPSKSSGGHSVNAPTQDVNFTPTGMPSWNSVRSRDSLVAAAPHRDLAMKTLLGESPVPESPTGYIANIWNGEQGRIESTAPSQTSVYSHMPSAHPLRRTPAGLQQTRAVGTFASSSSGLDGSRIDLDMAALPTLRRVETEGPLEKLERSLSHQSDQIALSQQLPPPLDLGKRPPKVCHKRTVGGKVIYGTQEESSEAGPVIPSSSGTNGPRRRRPEAIDYRMTPQAIGSGFLSRMHTEEDSAVDNVDLTDSTFPSRNPWRDSMNENANNIDNNNTDGFETLPATYYTGSGKGKGRSYD